MLDDVLDTVLKITGIVVCIVFGMSLLAGLWKVLTYDCVSHL